MKFTVSRDDIFRGVQACQRVIGGTTISPILMNVFLKAEAGGLSLIATDLELFHQCRVPATVETQGAIMIPAKNLAEILATLPAGTPLEIASTDEYLIEIRSEDAEYSLFGTAPEDFPSLPEIVEIHAFTLPSASFRSMLGQVSYAVSLDESKPDLRGVLFQGEGGVLRLVATDGRRLSVAETAVREGFEPFADVIVPAKVLQEIARLADGDSPVSIRVGKTQIVFSVGEVRYTSRLVDGKFPNWRGLIPSDRCCRLVVDTARFRESLRGVMPIAREISFTIRCKFDKGKLEISALSSKVGKGKRTLPIENDGEPITISYNAKYLADALATIHSEKVVLEPVSTVKATKITPLTAPEGEQHVNILMPIRTGV